MKVKYHELGITIRNVLYFYIYSREYFIVESRKIDFWEIGT